MTKSYCLTIEATSDHIENGLGYMIVFRLPPGASAPESLPEFAAWTAEVREIVLRTGDQPYHSDPYTKKLAIAELMHDLMDLNSKYAIRLGFVPEVPAVQIRSTNPYDNSIDIDFSSQEGHYIVVEKGLADMKRAHVSEHGKTGLTTAARQHFPFQKAPSKTVKKAPRRDDKKNGRPPRP